MKFTAVIPVREGSQRVKNKNIRPFADTNLLVHKIRQLKKCKDIDNIVVSSDSKLMLDMAKKESVECQERPLEYADEITKSFGEVVEYIAKNIKNTEHIMWVPCVCPLCDENIISLIIRAYRQHVLFSEKYDSIVTGKILREYIWDENKSLNYSLKNHVPSQLLPKWYSIVNGCFISSREQMIKNKFCHGKNPYIYEIDKISAIDIDDEYDLVMARALYDFTKFNKGENND